MTEEEQKQHNAKIAELIAARLREEELIKRAMERLTQIRKAIDEESLKKQQNLWNQ